MWESLLATVCVILGCIGFVGLMAWLLRDCKHNWEVKHNVAVMGIVTSNMKVDNIPFKIGSRQEKGYLKQKVCKKCGKIERCFVNLSTKIDMDEDQFEAALAWIQLETERLNKTKENA